MSKVEVVTLEEKFRTTPLQLMMLLHYYSIVAPYAENDPAHANSVGVSNQRRTLISRGLLEVDSFRRSGYRVTEKGEFFIDYICRLPEPVQHYTIPKGPNSV